MFTAAEAIEEAGGHALPIVGDIRDEAQVEAAEAPTVERYGGVDVCVINASAINLAGTEALDMRRYDLMQDVNTRATFVVSAPASRTSSRRRTRTSSRCRRRSASNRAGSARTSPAGPDQDARARSGAGGVEVRQDVRIGLSVNAVTPGLIETDMTAVVPAKARERLCAAIPVRRIGRPDEVARVVGFLAADASGYITGQACAVNGGLDM